MSSDELLLLRVLRALRKVKLEAILVGNSACALQGVPVMTQDIDFFVRDTVLNRRKLRKFADELGLVLVKAEEAIGETIRAEGKELVVDFVFRQGPRQTFERVRARATRIPVGDLFCTTAALEDILVAKTAAGRDKDKAVLNLIRDTIAVRAALDRNTGARRK